MVAELSKVASHQMPSTTQPAIEGTALAISNAGREWHMAALPRNLSRSHCKGSDVISLRPQPSVAMIPDRNVHDQWRGNSRPVHAMTAIAAKNEPIFMLAARATLTESHIPMNMRKIADYFSNKADANVYTPPHAAQANLSSLRVLIVDDSRDIVASMRDVIDSQPDMRCSGCLGSADRLVVMARKALADVVLLDATMPGKPPLTALRELTRELPDVRTIIFSGYGDCELVDSAFTAGAWGCVSKAEELETVLWAVREVAAGKIWLS